MENNVRFRNHFSIVLPNLKGILWLILMAFLSAILQEDMEEAIVTVLTWIAIIVIVLVWQIIVWAKTWITIEENSIVIERNTKISRKKNTIGIANISNVNLEQGLLAMLLGTCKLKLDTNSLSTANATDVTIVLKKNQAEQLRAWLMARISGEEEQHVNAVVQETLERESGAIVRSDSKIVVTSGVDKRIRVSGGDILLHGIFSSRFLYTIFVPLYIVLEFVTEMDQTDLDYIMQEAGNFAAESIGITLLILIAIISWMVLAMVFGLVKTAIKYWDFQIERKGQKILIEYGLTKKVNYSIPVDKIQAVVVKQSILARICRRYMVEVVNVGMNDDQKEVQGFLLPYGSKKLLQERVQMLLPEFLDCLELEVERQPKSIWIVWLWPVFIYILIMSGILFVVAEFVPDMLSIVCAGAVVLSIGFLVIKLMSYYTKGTKFKEEIFVAATGTFSRKYVYVKYENIQYLILKQSFLAKRVGVQRGLAMLLASTINQAQEIPFFAENEIEKIKERINAKWRK